jgi:2-isopropylmalate synthase
VNALNRLVTGGRSAPLHPQKAPLPVAELPRL